MRGGTRFWWGRSLLLTLGLLGVGPKPAAPQTGPGAEGQGGLPGSAFVGPRGLTLGLEAHLHRQADDLVSPLRYSGLSWGPSLGFGFSTPVEIRWVGLTLGYPKLTSFQTEAGAHLQKGYRADLELAVFHRVAGFRKNSLAFYLGGELRGDFALYDHWYSPEEKESWMHFFGLLQPGGAWSSSLPWGGEVWQKVTIPLMGLVMRPGYQGMTEIPDVVWEGVGGVTGFHQSIHYLQPLGARTRLGISYDYLALRYSHPRPLAWTRQGFTLFMTVWGGEK